jgi:hypothetical protein
MDLYDRFNELGEKAIKLISHVQNEEATKTALVLPFLQVLGYDVFDPTEVVPEFTADVGIKKGEKVDYAICMGDKPIILIECKPHGAKLESYSSQLYRYFSVTNARVAVLTDGIHYRFYSDLVEPNKLDSEPFLVLNLTNIKKRAAEQASKLSKQSFDIESILDSAEDLRYTSKIRTNFSNELENPSDELVRLLVDPFYSGRFTQQAMTRFKELVKHSLRTHISDAVDGRLRNALDQNKQEEEAKLELSTDSEEPKIVTTAAELEGFYAIKAILRDSVDPKRIAARDVQSYFGILLDDNNRKPICRLWFNGSSKHLGVFDENKIEIRIPVTGPNDLFQHAEAIVRSASYVVKD